jgi:hypothetical protein
MKELIIQILALTLAYQKADPAQETRIKQLEAERDRLAKENGDLNDPELKAQIEAVLANAKAQDPQTATQGEDNGFVQSSAPQPEPAPAPEKAPEQSTEQSANQTTEQPAVTNTDEPSDESRTSKRSKKS